MNKNVLLCLAFMMPIFAPTDGNDQIITSSMSTVYTDPISDNNWERLVRMWKVVSENRAHDAALTFLPEDVSFFEQRFNLQVNPCDFYLVYNRIINLVLDNPSITIKEKDSPGVAKMEFKVDIHSSSVYFYVAGYYKCSSLLLDDSLLQKLSDRAASFSASQAQAQS